MNDQPLFSSQAEWKFLGSLILVVFIVLIVSTIFSARVKEQRNLTPLVIPAQPFKEVELVAKAAFVYDARIASVLYARNEDIRLPLASITKVMSALVADEIAPPGSEVVVSVEALKATGDSGLRVGERWSLKDLLDFSLASSSNDGMKTVAMALGALSRSDATPHEAEADFVRMMNQKADDLGMKNTYFWNTTGLDESELKGGAYGTARDLSALFDYILRNRPELLEATKLSEFSVSSLDNYKHTARNTGRSITDLVPGLKASKTGFTDVAGGNLVIAFDPEVGRPIIVVVLGSTAEDRFTDVLKLVEASLEHINEN